MEDSKKVVMSLKPTGTATWKLRLYRILRYPMTRTGPAIVVSSLFYIVAYNVGVRLWKGEGHPVNRFMWRLQEQQGTLNPVLRVKKQAVLSYQEERLYRPKDTPPNLGYV